MGARDPKQVKAEGVTPLGITTEALKQMQDVNNTLVGVRKAADKSLSSFIRKNGFLYRQLRSPQPWEEDPGDQLVLSESCRQQVLAHSVPLGGHLGRKKTLRQIVQRFYWPTLGQDVADLPQMWPMSKVPATLSLACTHGTLAGSV